MLFNCDTCNQMACDKFHCNLCGRCFEKNSKQNNFLIYISLEHQIRRLLNKYFDEIIHYSKREHVNGVISDIDDGTLFKKVCEKSSHSTTLGFTLNTDGANIYKSSKGSLWPVQLYANFLPPNIRYLSKNIIVTTIYYGKTKPDMTTLLYPLAAEIDHLNEKLIHIYKENEIWVFRPTIILGVFDLPARAEVQGMKGPTGKYGCPICLHPGIAVKNLSGRTTIRYVQNSSVKILRTHDDTVFLMSKNAKDSIYGIKSSSALLLFDDIDVIHSIPIDNMHGFYLGIVKYLIEIWIGKNKFHRPRTKLIPSAQI